MLSILLINLYNFYRSFLGILGFFSFKRTGGGVVVFVMVRYIRCLESLWASMYHRGVKVLLCVIFHLCFVQCNSVWRQVTFLSNTWNMWSFCSFLLLQIYKLFWVTRGSIGDSISSNSKGVAFVHVSVGRWIFFFIISPFFFFLLSSMIIGHYFQIWIKCSLHPFQCVRRFWQE